jgi:hypothetical protein
LTVVARLAAVRRGVTMTDHSVGPQLLELIAPPGIEVDAAIGA